MAFFSTSDIFKSFLSGDLLKQIVTSDEFRVALKETFNNSGVTNEIASLVLSHPDVKKEIRKIILDILSDMGIRDDK